jgi:hypothetical protein
MRHGAAADVSFRARSAAAKPLRYDFPVLGGAALVIAGACRRRTINVIRPPVPGPHLGRNRPRIAWRPTAPDRRAPRDKPRIVCPPNDLVEVSPRQSGDDSFAVRRAPGIAGKG